MKFGVAFRVGNEKAYKVAQEAKDYLLKGGQEVFGEEEIEKAEVILTFGGDGTLMQKASQFAHIGAPFIGINTGNLGFLTAGEAKDLQKIVDAAASGKFYKSKRITLEVQVGSEKEKHVVVNDAVVKGQFRVVELDLRTDDQQFLKVSGDGVIVATETGSTAYSLSSGGPIVDPDIEAILVTPINPIGLPIPSFVLPTGHEISIELVRGSDVWLVLDGQEHMEVPTGQTIKVSRGKHDVVFGYLDKHHFLKSLNAKFGPSSRTIGT